MKITNFSFIIIFSSLLVISIIGVVSNFSFSTNSVQTNVMEKTFNYDENFRKLELYYFDHREKIDSISQDLNKDFNYDIPVVGHIHSYDSKELYSSIPFFGMFDGRNGFIYSTLFGKITTIRIYIQYDKYLVAGDGDRVYILNPINFPTDKEV